jgi:hypothetical protein
MKTLEEAILDLENWVSGLYREPFPDSSLRQNPEENIEFIKFNLETLLKAKKPEIREQAFENILSSVLDNHNTEYARVHSFIRKGEKGYINACIDECNTIITRLAEKGSEKEGEMSIEEINKKYHHTILYFNGDEAGSQYVYVEDIHRGEDCLEVDGVLIDYDLQDHTLSINPIENYNFGDFYYFDFNEEDWFTSTSDLDEALQDPPIDTELSSHVMSPEEVVKDILEIFRWDFVEGCDTRCPELGNIFTNIIKNI